MNESTLSLATGDGLRHKTTNRSQPGPFLPLGRISLRTVLWSLLLGIALLCPAFLLLAHFPVSAQAQQSHLKNALFPLTAVLLSVFLGPLLEELVYRGLFLQLARRYMPASLAILLSSGVFALTHIPKGIGVVLISFSFGCLFAWMVKRSGSLYPGFLCHVVVNYGAMFVVGTMFGITEKTLALSPGSTFRNPLTELFPAWWIVLSIVTAVTAFVVLRREFARSATSPDAGAKRAGNLA